MSTVARQAPGISVRGKEMPSSPIRKLMPLAEDAKRRGVHVYHLNIGQPDLETPLAMRKRLAEIREKVLAYSPSGGTAGYVDSVLAYYRGLGIELKPGQLLATTGGSEAIQFAFMATADVGREALVVEPFYTNYRAFAAMAGIRLVPVVAKGEDGFHLPSREAFEAALTPRTRLVVLCNPNNPTGTVYSREELEMVAGFCRDHDLFLVSDEVYREFVYDGREAISAHALAGYEDLVVVVDSLSKRFSACGVRLGSLSTKNPDVWGACMRMAEGRLSPPGLAQSIAVGASELGPDYYAGIVTEYQARRDILFEGLTAIPGVFLRKPEGAFYFVARLPVDDSEEFARFLLTDFQADGKTVMVAPAPGFYATPGLGRDEVRIAYVLNGGELKDSVHLLSEAIPAYRRARGLD
jgi:aspartate aminotransferase